jgi:hypothetical protein
VTRSYSVFTMHSASSPRTSCHFRIFEDDEVRQCLSSRSIWILHESLGRDLYEYLVAAIGTESDGDDHDDGDHGEMLRDQQRLRFDDEATSTVLSFDKLSVLFDGEDHQFQALTSFQRDGFRQFLSDIVAEHQYKEVIFGSILHDIIHWSWYQEPTPSTFYELLIEALLTLCSVMEEHHSSDFTVYLWPGISPSFNTESRFGWMAKLYPMYIRAFLRGANDFVDRHEHFADRLVLIDTVHVSDGHYNRHYTDDVHWGATAVEHYPGASTIVNDMAAQIVLNHLCS